MVVLAAVVAVVVALLEKQILVAEAVAEIIKVETGLLEQQEALVLSLLNTQIQQQ
jgi:hypothetical protein